MRFFGVLFLVFFVQQLVAQDPLYRKLDISNGLPTNEVYEMHQDKKGYIWIGHDKGISRYTGYKWKTFTHNEMRGTSLSFIKEDDEGTIWCINFSGQIFYIKNDEMYRLKEYNTANAFYHTNIYVYKNILYAAEKDALFTYDITNKIAKRYGYLNTQNNNIRPIFSTLMGIGDSVYCNTSVGVLLFYQNRFRHEDILSRYYPNPKKLNTGPYTALINNESKILHYSRGGTTITVVDKKTKKIDKLIRTNIRINVINKFANKIYINTPKGYYTISDNALLPVKFADYSIADQLIDTENNLWVSTLFDGVIIASDKGNINYSLGTEKRVELIYPIAKRNLVVIGTQKGEILFFSTKDRRVIHRYSLNATKETQAIYYDATTDNLLVCAGELHCINMSNPIKFRIIAGAYSMHSILRYKDRILFSSTAGVDFFPSKEVNYPSQKELHKKIPFILTEYLSRNGRSYNLVLDSVSDAVYFTSVEGLFTYNAATVKEVKYQSQSIFGRKMMYYRKSIYIGSLNKGIYEITPTKAVVLINSNENLKHIYDFTCSGNYLFGICDSGIVKMNLTTKKVELLTQSDGFLPNQLKSITSINNMVYVSSDKSLISFDNSIQSLNKIPPKVYVTKVFANDSIRATNELLNLNYTDNSIEIAYDAISFRSMANIKVFYRIVEKNRTEGKWLRTEPTEGSIKIPSLSSGKYTVEIKAYNNSDIPSKTARVFLHVHPPFWQTWWFIGLLLLLTATVIFYYMYLRIKRIRFQNQLILDKVTLEKDLRQSILTSIRSQMNPHFVFNALNTIHSYIYTSDKVLASDYLIKFSDLTRLILEMSAKESVTLKEEIEALELYVYLEKVRLDNQLDYSIQVADNLNIEYVRIPPMLVQPYVENAVKHGLMHSKLERKLRISFYQEENILFIEIVDNGIGREKAELINNRRRRKHVSFAANANEKRLEIINQERIEQKVGISIFDLVNDDNKAIGTKVVIQIPV